MACHTRSVSLPTRSHPFLIKAEEQLNKLRACIGSSSSHKYEILLDALKTVGNVYESINDLLCMSSNQTVLSHRRWVDQELEESIKLLDTCSTSSNNLEAIQDLVRDLELATRRGASQAMKSKLKDYNLIIKKANKDVMRQICKTDESADGGDSLVVYSFLRETRKITISILQSIFLYLSRQIVVKNSSKWSLVSRLLEKKTIACKEEIREDTFDASYLIVNVQELENGVENLFRHLIKCRGSLLNICSM